MQSSVGALALTNTQIQMGMKNHDLVPVELIVSIAKLRHGGTHKILSTLLTFKLIAHDRSAYDGKRIDICHSRYTRASVLISV